ncbi:reverse transcriptase family [Fusarium heterosporum]|uniref:Reverse transcriptase family n=1 Tax=Fusarium heterosporum TaxID=42747 RepID=A0A8H5TSZ2_FUSHE|nr:reverse transcriptase family [Fusarium heterosporum]
MNPVDLSSFRVNLDGPGEDQWKALSSIQQHIVKTIGNYYSTIDDKRDIAKELALLKARVQPTDWAHEREVLERYCTVLKAPNISSIETWITSWQRILTEAQKLDLHDIKNLRSTGQSLQAASSFNSVFTVYWINNMEDEARNESNWQDSFPYGIKISEILEPSHKAKRETSIRATKVAMGESSKATRPNGWKPNEHIEYKINQKFEDPVLKKKVNRSLERLAGQRPQKPQGVQDHQNNADVQRTAFAGRHVTQEAQGSTFATSVCPLTDYFVLGSGSDTHVCNNKDRFVSYMPLTIEEVAHAGDSQSSILGYGQVDLRFKEGGIFISNEGHNWTPQTGAVTIEGKIVFHMKRINRPPVIECHQIRPKQAPSAFSPSSESRLEQVREATRWHQRLGHPNPEAMNQLPFWRVYIDAFHLHEGYNRKKTALPIKEEFTDMIFAYFHPQTTQAAPLDSLKPFDQRFNASEAQGRTLPLIWVFKYKLNNHGFLTRFQARQCVRGDLQQPNNKETYEATLAGRFFHLHMAATEV